MSPSGRRTDPRYGSRRWQAVRLAVLRRDLRMCRVVDGCRILATVADHVIPAAPGMPDSLFFSLDNLRASCRDHNIARGFAAKLVAPSSGHPSDVVTGDYS